MLVDEHRMLPSPAHDPKGPATWAGRRGGDGAGRSISRGSSRGRVVMDIGLVGMSGIEATRMLAENPASRCSCLSTFGDRQGAADAGGRRPRPRRQVCRQRGIAARHTAVARAKRICMQRPPRRLSTACASPHCRAGRTKRWPARARGAATPRQRQDFGPDREELRIATSTVEVLARNIMRKLDLHNVAN